MIQTQELGRTFGGRFGQEPTMAVKRLDLTIQQGELFGLVGSDGAGKTTFLRMLAGILEPTSGCATVDGNDIVKNAEAIKQELGYMPQRFGLYQDLSVDENLNFICDVFNVSGSTRNKRIHDLLTFTNLHEFRRRRSKHLSGGMQKKLGLAAALVHQPKLLLLDEPTTGVDPIARREFWDILTELHASGSTIVVCTPYMDEAERCNRVGLMYAGQLIACDTPNALKHTLPGVVYTLHADDLLRAEQALKSLPSVLDVQPYGDVLNLIMPDESHHDQIADRLIQHAVTIESLRPAPPRLEEIFIYLVRQYDKQSTADQEKSA